VSLKVVFMGSPEFAVPVFRALHAEFDVTGVVTQKNKPKGRGRTPMPTAVKQAADELEVPVFEPDRLSSPEVLDALRELAPDFIVVAAYGKILPKSILDLPPMGCINLHGSLLPKYRGASPIPAAILSGDKVAGVSTMLMDKGMDTGDILLEQEVPIENDDTAQSLHDKLLEPGARLVVDTLRRIAAGDLRPTPQDHGKATYTNLLTKEDGRIDWNVEAARIERLVRAMIPWPVAFFEHQGDRIKVWRSSVAHGTAKAGEIAQLSPEGILVGAGENLLLLREAQAPGKKRISAAEFARGRRLSVGDFLSS
jgi:methionyl-tRNA formyltransferase